MESERPAHHSTDILPRWIGSPLTCSLLTTLGFVTLDFVFLPKTDQRPKRAATRIRTPTPTPTPTPAFWDRVRPPEGVIDVIGIPVVVGVVVVVGVGVGVVAVAGVNVLISGVLDTAAKD